jgi:hypothetical protein
MIVFKHVPPVLTLSFIPQAQGLFISERALREYMGMLVYVAFHRI